MSGENRGIKKTKDLVLTAILFAIALVLSVVEGALPQLPIVVPGVKFGLSNIVVMYALFFLGIGRALGIASLKSFFVFLTRGAVAGGVSLCGGLISLFVMAILMYIFKDRVSYLILSIAGGVAHNIGQILGISLVYSNIFIFAYLPILLVSGVIAGGATATLLKVALPALKNINKT